MKWFSLLFVFCSVFLYPQRFHSLDGIENHQNETLLLYRIGYDYFHYNPVVKLNTSTLQENYIMHAFYFYFPPAEQARAVYDFEFFPGDENNFVNTGYVIDPDNHLYIARNDTAVAWDIGDFHRIDISKQNSLKVFAFSTYTARSFDGGYSYPPDSVIMNAGFEPLSVADFDDNIFFGTDEEQRFAKSGNLVDTSAVFFNRYFKMMYDKDAQHVYRVNKTYDCYSFNVSYNRGNAFTWSETYRSENPFYVTLDSSLSGNLYLADGNLIYKSENHGYSFNLYRSLPYKINGLYKKPGGGALYASTPFKIFEITADTASVIKSLPLPENAFDWFPLAIGNRWVFNLSLLNDYCWPDTTVVEQTVITGDTVMFGETYFKFNPPLAGEYEYMRIDSAEGKLKTLSHAFPTEHPVYDFYMEPGDYIYFDPAWPYGGFYLESEDSILAFNAYRPIRKFMALSFLPPSFSLVKGMGYYSDAFCEFGGFSRTLKGCLINGVVFGDTTLTGVYGDENIAPDKFNLFQNYPNPFNPFTTIKFSTKERAFVELNIYDQLGREIKTLIKEEKPAGIYRLNFDASNLPSGVYFYKLRAGNFIQTRKMILMK